MATTITIPAGISILSYAGATALALTGANKWDKFTAANFNGIYKQSSNRLGFIACAPTSSFPAFTTLEVVATGQMLAGYIFNLKQAITVDSNLFSVLGTTPAANQAPSVSFSPTTNSAPTVGVQKDYLAVATDQDGSIVQVDLVQVTSATNLTVVATLASDAASPYSLSWTPTTAGTFYLAVRATDNQNAVSFSSVLTATVSAAVATNNNVFTYTFPFSL